MGNSISRFSICLSCFSFDCSKQHTKAEISDDHLSDMAHPSEHTAGDSSTGPYAYQSVSPTWPHKGHPLCGQYQLELMDSDQRCPFRLDHGKRHFTSSDVCIILITGIVGHIITRKSVFEGGMNLRKGAADATSILYYKCHIID